MVTTAFHCGRFGNCLSVSSGSVVACVGVGRMIRVVLGWPCTSWVITDICCSYPDQHDTW